MRIATLMTDRGPVECWEPRPGFYLACSHWTAGEAERYAWTGQLSRSPQPMTTDDTP